MTQSLIALLPENGTDDIRERLNGYGSLQVVEAWRWTALDALLKPARKDALADYQLDVAEDCEEGLLDDAAVRARWLDPIRRGQFFTCVY